MGRADFKTRLNLVPTHVVLVWCQSRRNFQSLFQPVEILMVRTLIAALCFAALFICAPQNPGWAQSATPPTRKTMADCRVIMDAMTRLFCYDRLVDDAAASQARPVLRAPEPSPATPSAPVVATPPPSVPSSPPVQTTRPAEPAVAPRQAAQPSTLAKPMEPPATALPTKQFGEENLRSSQRARPSELEVGEIHAHVAKVSADPYGKTILTLDNGQIWRQVEGDKYRISPGTGVTISKGVLGAYFLTADTASLSVKFKRIQ